MNAMKLSALLTAAAATLLTGCNSMNRNSAMPSGAAAPDLQRTSAMSAEQIIAAWPERPRLGAAQMMAKYGRPHEVTSERLVWHNVGAFKRVAVLKLETPHNFPLPHVDFLEHTIAYDVPQDKVGDLIAFDASSTINRTVGELSARCDLEGHNILTLNLDHDIVTGKKTVAQARQAFGDIVKQDVAGKHPPYVEALQFQPPSASATPFADKPVIAGSPLPPAEAPAASRGTANAEILATVIAVDMNEVLAAGQAKMKKLSAPVMDYAKMLHEHHGMNMDQTMKLGLQIGVTPVNTPKVERVQKKGAAELAALVPLNGEPFERAYIAAMIKGHEEALNMIDNDLVKAASNEPLKNHLAKTRAEIAAHLEKAKTLQGRMKG